MGNFLDDETLDDMDSSAEFADVPGDTDVEPEPEVMPDITEEQVSRAMADEGLTPEDPVLDALELECEQRFEVAMYYRTLLKGRLFNENTKASRIVENEARAFFKERLEMLLGIRTKPVAAPPPVTLPFTPEQITVLAAVADKLIKKPSLAETHPAPAPTLRRAPVPAPAPVPTAKTQATPEQPRKVPVSAKKSVKAKVIDVPKKDNGVVEDSGKVIKAGHKVYRVVKNELGTEFKQDITGQGNPTTKVPMPTGGALEQLTQIQAANQVSKLNIQVGGHKVGVQQLVNKVTEE